MDSELSLFWGYVNCLNEETKTEDVEGDNNIEDWLEEENIIDKGMLRNIREKIENGGKYIESSIYEIENISDKIDGDLRYNKEVNNCYYKQEKEGKKEDWYENSKDNKSAGNGTLNKQNIGVGSNVESDKAIEK